MVGLLIMDELKWYFTQGLASFAVRSIELSENYSTKPTEPTALSDEAVRAATKEKRIRATLARLPDATVRLLARAFGHCPPSLHALRAEGAEYPAVAADCIEAPTDDKKRNARLMRAAIARSKMLVDAAVAEYVAAKSRARKERKDEFWRYISGK